MINTIKLAHGSGGREMGELIKFIRKHISFTGDWECTDEDSAVLSSINTPQPPSRGDNPARKIAFTTDAFVIDPIFFPGGNIGDLAFNGTLNDLLMQGAEPLGISLALVLEEGLPFSDFEKILKSIGGLSKATKIPIATGDTKVVPRGALDKIMITTSGVGIVERILTDRGISPGDKIIASGTLGDHGAALLAVRFNYRTNLKSDTKSLLEELRAVKNYLTAAKDPTRGGMAAVLNEMAEKSRVKIILDEEKIPVKKETAAIARLLGMGKYALASEGRFIAGVRANDAELVLENLKKFDKNAIIMGEAINGDGVYIKNKFRENKLNTPEGVLVPRIC